MRVQTISLKWKSLSKARLNPQLPKARAKLRKEALKSQHQTMRKVKKRAKKSKIHLARSRRRPRRSS